MMSNHSTSAVTAVVLFNTELLLVWYCLNNQAYSLSVTGNDIGPHIYPWGTSLLLFFLNDTQEMREMVIIQIENVNW